jgi:hypothetical protein
MKKITSSLFLILFLVPASLAQTLSIPTEDNTTCEGKVMFGYQGYWLDPDDDLCQMTIFFADFENESFL